MRPRDGSRLYTAHVEFGPNDDREDVPHFTEAIFDFLGPRQNLTFFDIFLPVNERE